MTGTLLVLSGWWVLHQFTVISSSLPPSNIFIYLSFLPCDFWAPPFWGEYIILLCLTTSIATCLTLVSGLWMGVNYVSQTKVYKYAWPCAASALFYKNSPPHCSFNLSIDLEAFGAFWTLAKVWGPLRHQKYRWDQPRLTLSADSSERKLSAVASHWDCYDHFLYRSIDE